MNLVERARQLRPIIEKASESLTDVDAVNAVELFPYWNPDSIQYLQGFRVQYGDLLYKCLQTHISQSTWTPSDAPSLWVRIDDPSVEWPEWRQPLGATDAYPQGAKVSHNDKHWVSDLDNNVWEPGAYGWTEQI